MSDGIDSDCEELRPTTVKKRSNMKMFIVILVIGLIGAAVAIPTVIFTNRNSSLSNSAENEVITYDFPFVNRAGWNARKPVQTLPLPTPVPYVVIHHSYMPPACYNKKDCVQAMQSMQNFHMDDRRWWDIGYSFAVGSDGVAYEGRGWTILGAHALHFNTVSIGICVIGDWTKTVPPAEQLKTVQKLIAAGVELGYIKADYKLVGHRQVRATECPGQTFFDVIKTWNRWVSFPASDADLINVPELSDEARKLLNSTTVKPS